MANEEHKATQKKGSSGEGCPAVMQDGMRCARPIHTEPGSTYDEGYVCLMHSRDPGKDDAEFQKEFEAILKAAGDGAADFRGFVFPTSDYRGRKFTAACVFDGATFMQDAGFRGVTFGQGASFNLAGFMQRASFEQSAFIHDTAFFAAVFARNAHFRGAEFAEEADFKGATFAEDAVFTATKFAGDADFGSARFVQGVYFVETEFSRRARFWGTRFLSHADFRRARFRHDETGLAAGPIFSLAEFAQPEKVRFYRTYLGQALFYNCDVSRVNFSLVEWRQRKGSGKWMVFEEEVDLQAAPDLGAEDGAIDERRYWLIVELYQRLKKNYDERKDYGTAGDFHYGELEMKRLATPRGRVTQLVGGKILGQQRMSEVRRWWHRHLSLVALYKYASHYGESYGRPLFCMALVLLLFTFLFPIVGLDWNDTKSPPGGTSGTQQSVSQTANNELSYGHFSDFVKAYKGQKWLARSAFFGNSLMTALSVAGFQKELKYEPSYPWGRALALLELLLTSTLAALFLLAVRRQFRR